MQDDNEYLKLTTAAERKRWARQNNLMYGGLIAIGVVILQGFLNITPLGMSGRITVISLAISIPLLGVLILLGELHQAEDKRLPGFAESFTQSVGLTAAFTGVIAAFWHVDWIAGVCVLGAGVYGFVIYTALFGKSRYSEAVSRRAVQRAQQLADAKEAKRSQR